MLADGQDPNAPEARLAFHLHRLGLTGQKLQEAMGGKARISTALSHARMVIEPSTITELAASLSVTAEELTRPLSDEENRQWRFYRSSARSPIHVWREAERRWTSAGLNQREVAEIIGIPQNNISRSQKSGTTDTIDWQQAKLLLSATNSIEEPEALLPEPDRTLDIPDYRA